jgi:hypothetical protein
MISVVVFFTTTYFICLCQDNVVYLYVMKYGYNPSSNLKMIFGHLADRRFMKRINPLLKNRPIHLYLELGEQCSMDVEGYVQFYNHRHTPSVKFHVTRCLWKTYRYWDNTYTDTYITKGSRDKNSVRSTMGKLLESKVREIVKNYDTKSWAITNFSWVFCEALPQPHEQSEKELSS